MNQIESQMQQDAMKEIEHIFKMRYYDHTVNLVDKNKKETQYSVIFHCPNGGQRNVREGAKFKRMGVKSGIPDLIVPINNGKHNQLWIEIKQGKGSQEDNQQEWERVCPILNIRYEICRTKNEIVDLVLDYMEGINQ